MTLETKFTVKNVMLCGSNINADICYSLLLPLFVELVFFCSSFAVQYLVPFLIVQSSR